MNDYVVSLIRTYVPIVVGAGIAWLVSQGIEVPDGAQAGVTAAAVGAYYAVLRALERRWPAFGWFLGAPKTPTYG